MADISRIWISKTSRYNEKTRNLEYFYECDLRVEGEKGVSVKLNLTDEMLTEVYKVIHPALREALMANVEVLPDEL